MKISGSQLFWIINLTSNTSYIVLSPALVQGRQDAWIVLLIAATISLGLTFLMSRVSLMLAGKGMVQFNQELFGKWFGTFVTLLYFVVWFSIMVVRFRDWVDYVYLALLRSTPVYVTLGLTVVFVLYMTTRGGLKGIGRFGEVVGPLFVLTMVIPLLMMPNALDWNQLLPLYVNSGWNNILQGILACVGQFSSPAMTLFMIAQFVANPQHLRWVPMWGIGLMSLWTAVGAIVCVLYVGAYLAPRCTLPWLTYIKSINILEFVQNIDVFSSFVWALIHPLGIAIWLFITSYGISEWWNTKYWKAIAVVLCVAACVCALLTLRMTHFTTIVRQTILVPWVLPVNMIGIPLLMWIVGSWKIRTKRMRPWSAPTH